MLLCPSLCCLQVKYLKQAACSNTEFSVGASVRLELASKFSPIFFFSSDYPDVIGGHRAHEVLFGEKRRYSAMI